jgi:adhesin/invasin
MRAAALLAIGVAGFATAALALPSGLRTALDDSLSASSDSISAPPPATHFALAADSPQTAGTPFEITVTALDASDGTVPGYSGTVSFTSSDGNAALPGPYTFTGSEKGVQKFTVTLGTAGSQTITATDAAGNLTGITDPPVTVNEAPPISTFAAAAGVAGAADPGSTTISADPTDIAANGFSDSLITVQLKDALGNDVTSSSGVITLQTTGGTLQGDGVDAAGQVVAYDNDDGTYSAFLTSSTTVGDVTISGALDGSPLGHTATVTFSEPQPYILLTPDFAAIGVGESQTYTVTQYDASGNVLGNVTADATLSISPDGSCTGATCTPPGIGDYIVTAQFSGLSATAYLTVATPYILMAPESARIGLGGSQTYAVTSYDPSGNVVADVTSKSTLTIEPDGSCTGATCTPASTGDHLVTAHFGDLTATADLTVTAPPKYTQCPPIGQSQGCGILIVVTNTGINVLEDPDVGPFDGSEDTLVGVQNDSSATVTQVTLSGGVVNIFGFEGDGLCAFTACEWLHPTTYEGPTTSFANINADATVGDVLFNPGLAPGQSTYLSLEEKLTAATIQAITFDLSPATASNPVGTQHTVVAAITEGGSALAGKSVAFSVTDGPDKGQTGTGTTDVNGTAAFTYTNNGSPGTDTISASFDDAGVTHTARATKTWVALATHAISGKILVAGVDGDLPVAGATVTACGGSSGTECTSTVSASDGDYSLTGLRDGGWTVLATPPTGSGLQPKGVKVTVDGGDVTQDIVLAAIGPNLEVTVDVTPPAPVVGNAVTFAYHVTNRGNAAATAVAFTLSPPQNATLVSVMATSVAPPSFASRRALAATFSPDCTPIGTDVNCALGTLAPGGGSLVTMIVTPTAAGPLSATSTVGSVGTSTSSQTTSVTVTSGAAGGGVSGGGGGSSGGGSSGGGGATTTTTTTTTGGTATIASVTTPSGAPPAPPPPTQPGEVTAIGRCAVVNGQLIPDGQVITLKTGDLVDVTNGAITMTNFSGGTATFSADQPTPGRGGPSAPCVPGPPAPGQPLSAFRLDQSAAAGTPTIITLAGGNFTVCGATRSAASASAPKTVVRELWGSAKGKFRTVARYSSATVRGTVWQTQDRCDGSLVRVVEDIVDVFDFSLKTTIAVGPGQSYLALPKRQTSTVKPKKKAAPKKSAKPAKPKSAKAK